MSDGELLDYLRCWHEGPGGCDDLNPAELVLKVRALLAAERERCAKVAQSLPYESWDMDDGTRDRIAAAIRGA